MTDTNQLLGLANTFMAGVSLDAAILASRFVRNWGVELCIWVNTANIPRDSDCRLARATDKHFTGKPNRCNNVLKVSLRFDEPTAFSSYQVVDQYGVHVESATFEREHKNNGGHADVSLVPLVQRYLRT